MTQLFRIEDTIGKTIKRIKLAKGTYTYTYIIFDDSFIIIELENQGGWDEPEFDVLVNTTPVNRFTVEMVEVGITSQLDYDLEMEKIKQMQIQAEKERLELIKKRAEEKEKAEYKRLKQKYG